MRERAGRLSERRKNASDDPAIGELLDSLGVFKVFEKAEQWHEKLRSKAINDSDREKLIVFKAIGCETIKSLWIQILDSYPLPINLDREIGYTLTGYIVG
jgi:hypothetical protein